jgi:PAT family beta-lactamase induction signal transducer AmpG
LSSSRIDYRALISNPRIGIMLFLGFSSGLPLALSGGTLQAWLADSEVDIRVIGLFGLAGLPYVLKFLWAPLMDRFVPPWLGRRRGWMALSQISMMVLLAIMASQMQSDVGWMLAITALMIAFMSATQDISVDAYRADTLRVSERGMGAAVSVAGYRIAMLISGGLALVLADQIGWTTTYLIMAALMAIGLLSSLFGPEAELEQQPPATLQQAVIEPFTEFMSRNSALLILIMIILYKLGDAFAGTLTTAFLIKGPGFSLTDIGVINKTTGLLATLLGGLWGGVLMFRFGLYRSLMLFGIFQAVTNLGFMFLSISGKSYLGLILVIGAENLAGGMGTAAFVALLISLCHHRYTATQFALLSSLAAIGRVFVGPAAGVMVAGAGWTWFFLFTAILALPGLALLWYLRGSINALEK